MSIGNRLKNYLKARKVKINRKKSQESEIKAIERKEYFKARKYQAKVLAKERAKLERKQKLAKIRNKNIGFAKALGLARSAGERAKGGTARLVGIKKKGKKLTKRIKKKGRKSVKTRSSNGDYFSGFGF